MKKLYYASVLLLFIALSHKAHSQTSKDYGDPLLLGNRKDFLQYVQTPAGANQQGRTNPVIDLRIPSKASLKGKINFQQADTQNAQYVIGEVEGHPSSTFFITVGDNLVDGKIILPESKKAYQYYSDKNGNVFLKEININKALCVNYVPPATQAASSQSNVQAAANSVSVLSFESFSGGAACLYLDFNGQTVSGTPWKGGNTINAQPYPISDANLEYIWKAVSEDYLPFNINVTTSESVFLTYPLTRRMRCIFTPTNFYDAEAAGVAYLNSFTWNDHTPCWVFTSDITFAATAASHELGHTLGLSHDGRTSPSEEYYYGHNDWAPIMGSSFNSLMQWSKGEYPNASNREDDLAIISDLAKKFGYRYDDNSKTLAAGGKPLITACGSVLEIQNKGIIGTNTDTDVFSFTTTGGTASIYFNTPPGALSNLKIMAKLYNSSKAVILQNITSGFVRNLTAGTYYLEIDGAGYGDPVTNSDYGSMGAYSITGYIPGASPVIGEDQKMRSETSLYYPQICSNNSQTFSFPNYPACLPPVTWTVYPAGLVTTTQSGNNLTVKAVSATSSGNALFNITFADGSVQAFTKWIGLPEIWLTRVSDQVYFDNMPVCAGSNTLFGATTSDFTPVHWNIPYEGIKVGYTVSFNMPAYSYGVTMSSSNWCGAKTKNLRFTPKTTGCGSGRLSSEFTETMSSPYEDDLIIQPNPAALGKTTIIIPGFLTKAHVKLIDVHGNLLVEKIVYKAESELELSGVSQGIYFIKVYSASQTLSKRLMVE